METNSQKTIKETIAFDGIGLHNGIKVNLSLKPAEINSGIVFKRTDVDSSKSIIQANFKNVSSPILCTKIKNSHGEEIIVVQIAGLVARRIVTDTSVEENVDQGSRIGMIRFGSRADLYFENYEPLVKVNQRAVAGETLIAKR